MNGRQIRELLVQDLVHSGLFFPGARVEVILQEREQHRVV